MLGFQWRRLFASLSPLYQLHWASFPCSRFLMWHFWYWLNQYNTLLIVGGFWSRFTCDFINTWFNSLPLVLPMSSFITRSLWLFRILLQVFTFVCLQKKIQNKHFTALQLNWETSNVKAPTSCRRRSDFRPANSLISSRIFSWKSQWFTTAA